MRHIPVSTRHWMDVDSTFFECCGRQMDVKTTLCAYKNPVNTGRYLDFDSTFFECCGRQLDVKNDVVC